MKTKLLVVVLLVVCFTLGGALYATAAPSGSPSKSKLSMRLGILAYRVKTLQARLEQVENGMRSLGCSSDQLFYLFDLIRSGDPLPDRAHLPGCLVPPILIPGGKEGEQEG